MAFYFVSYILAVILPWTKYKTKTFLKYERDKKFKWDSKNFNTLTE